MESLPTNCPRCEAFGPFRPRQRLIEDNHVEIYLRCTTCNWTSILRQSTVEIEHLRKVKTRWHAYDHASVARYGVSSSLAKAQIQKIGRKIRELEDEIN